MIQQTETPLPSPEAIQIEARTAPPPVLPNCKRKRAARAAYHAQFHPERSAAPERDEQPVEQRTWRQKPPTVMRPPVHKNGYAGTRAVVKR